MDFSSIIIEGIFFGISLAVLSAGLAIVVNVIKVINLSHGAFFLLGCYIAYSASPALKGTGILYGIAFAGPFLLGLFLGRAVVNPLRRDSFSVSVATLSIAILFEQVAQFVWGDRALSISQGQPLFTIGKSGIMPWQVKELAFLFFILLFFIIFPRTKTGMAMKVTSSDEEMAKSVGVDTDLSRSLAFALACGLSSLAGLFIAPGIAIGPAAGRMPLIMSLLVVILSGCEKLLPVIFSAILLGITVNLIAFYLSSYLAYILVLALTIVLLSIRPGGLFGVILEREY